MKPSITMLNLKEIHDIDIRSRELLWDVGINVHDDEALKIYHEAGAQVDFSKHMVRIPSHMINDALSKCAPGFELYGRDNIAPMKLGGMRSYFGTIGFASFCADPETNEHRPVTCQDLTEIIQLADVLNPPDFILTPGTPADVPGELADLYEFKIGLMTTRKHRIIQAQNNKQLDQIIRMACLVSGGLENLQKKPFFSVLVTLTSPLMLRSDSSELIIKAAQNDLPLFIESGPMCGGTGPATMAGTLITANAELLNSIVLAKIINPRVPLIYASWARILDMKCAGVSHGGPEFGMFRICTTQMAKYYNLPSGGGGILADSKQIDPQLGMEKLGTALLPALAGTNMILGMGLFAEENTMSKEVLMIDNEITGYVQRILQGVDVNDHTTDLSILKEVGPGGTFIDKRHTFENYRKEMWIPNICHRGMTTTAAEKEDVGIRGNAKIAIDKALRNYMAPSLPENIEEKLDEIISE
jgi:trimethylamine---corrinoid protein Co-methyltransferase